MRTTIFILCFSLFLIFASSFSPSIQGINGKQGLPLLNRPKSLAYRPDGVYCLEEENNNVDTNHLLEREVPSVTSLLQRPQPEGNSTSSYYLYQPNNFIPGDKNTWDQLCPSIWDRNDQQKNLDVSVVWTDDDCPMSVAKTILPPEFASDKGKLNALTESLEMFRRFCQENLIQDGIRRRRRYKARLVATRGPTGTKCPQWHIDHVPVRWVQAMVGPGCHIVGSCRAGVNWSAINGLDDDDDEAVVSMSVEERNNALVDTKVANIYITKEQEAVLLLGNRWNDLSKRKEQGEAASSFIQPVVHKSPSRIPMWQGRVLLTQDVLDD